MFNPRKKALQPTNVKNSNMRIFSLFGKKVGLWYGKMLSYINWFTTNGKKQVYQQTISDDSNHTIDFKTGSQTGKTDDLFINAKDTPYLAVDDEVLIDNAPIILVAGDDYPIGIGGNDYSGEIIICYVSNGTPHTDRYTGEDVPDFLADEDTEVAIFGDIHVLHIYSAKQVRCYRSSLTELYIQEQSDGMHYTEQVTLIGNTQLEWVNFTQCTRLTTIRLLGNTSLENLITTNCSALTNIEVENNPNLQTLNLSGCGDLRVLDVSKEVNLRVLNIEKCYGIQQLNISGNINLQTLLFSDAKENSFVEIKAHAFSENIANTIVQMIGSTAIGTPGVVYIGRTDQYKSIIENAVQSMSWWTVKYYV